MITQTHIPDSIEDAESHLSSISTAPVEQLSASEFAKAWSSVCFLNPGLHPDGYEEADSGWPESLRKFAVDAWRRFDAGEIGEEVMYPSDATHAGVMALMAASAAA